MALNVWIAVIALAGGSEGALQSPPAPGRARITVVDSMGLPLPGATVTLRDTGGQTRVAVTDAQGAARIGRLPAGRYNMDAALQGFELAKRSRKMLLDVAADSDREMAVRM